MGGSWTVSTGGGDGVTDSRGSTDGVTVAGSIIVGGV